MYSERHIESSARSLPRNTSDAHQPYRLDLDGMSILISPLTQRLLSFSCLNVFLIFPHHEHLDEQPQTAVKNFVLQLGVKTNDLDATIDLSKITVRIGEKTYHPDYVMQKDPRSFFMPDQHHVVSKQPVTPNSTVLLKDQNRTASSGYRTVWLGFNAKIPPDEPYTVTIDGISIAGGTPLIPPIEFTPIEIEHKDKSIALECPISAKMINTFFYPTL